MVLVATSLLWLSVPAYDPTGWLIWGRELVEGGFQTLGGPSWKPLPVAFTTPFALAGDDAAPLLWLAVARLGGLSAVVIAFLLGRRLGGLVPGALAAAGLLLETDFVWNSVRGDSEGILVALALGAVLAHLEGRHRLALVLGVLAGGLRPEVWPVLVLYGIWLLRRGPRPGTLALVGGSGIALLAAWFVPDAIATGDWFQSGDRAIIPVAGTPATKPFPFGAALVEAAPLLVWPLYLGAAYAGWRARRRETPADSAVLVLALTGACLILLVALLAQFVGFTGNIRYAILPGALLAVAGAVGLPALVARLPVVLRVAGLAGAALAVFWSAGALENRIYGLTIDQRVLAPSLDEAIHAAGGPAAVRACGPIATTALERQRVAYVLGVPPRTVSTSNVEAGTVLVRRLRAPDDGPATLPIRAVIFDWTVHQAC